MSKISEKKISNSSSEFYLRLIFLFTISFMFHGGVLHAQNSTSSPYSRFGIGDLNSTTFARNLGMGGTELGLNQGSYINYGNPAAYSNLWYTTYEGAFNFRQYEFKTDYTEHHSHTSTVSYFDFGFPIKPQKWGVGFGLIPYSQVGYLVTAVNKNTFGDEEISHYEGSGGINNFHIGSGIKISKKLSFGFNAEYLFGVIDYKRLVGYNSVYYVGTSMASSTTVGWFHFNFGLQFKKDSLLWAKSDSVLAFESQIRKLNSSIDSVSIVKSKDSYDEMNRLSQEIEKAKLDKKNVQMRKGMGRAAKKDSIHAYDNQIRNLENSIDSLSIIKSRDSYEEMNRLSSELEKAKHGRKNVQMRKAKSGLFHFAKSDSIRSFDGQIKSLEHSLDSINDIRSADTSWYAERNRLSREIDEAKLGRENVEKSSAVSEMFKLAQEDSIRAFDEQIAILQHSLDSINVVRSADTSWHGERKRIQYEIAEANLGKDNVFQKKGKSDWNFVLGLVASPQTDLHARNSLLVNSFRYRDYGTSNVVILSRDTVLNTEGERTYIRLPLRTGLGFSLTKGTKWIFCGDFTFQKWSNFSYLGEPDSLQDSWKVSAGIQFTPNDRSINSYLKTMQYRVGFHYEKGFLNLKGESINDIGVSAGFSMPIRKAGTNVHIALETGERGTKAQNLILERYFKITIGFTVNDRWFVKSKYD